jgi:hypothetical protein
VVIVRSDHHASVEVAAQKHMQGGSFERGDCSLRDESSPYCTW